MATVLITGANRGICLALCKDFHARGDTVIATCRNSSPELDQLGVEIHTLDVTDTDSVAALSRALDGRLIDVLINNAGVLYGDTLQALNYEAMETQFQVNALGPLKVTQGLLGNLQSGSKVVIVTSRMGSMADNTSGRSYGYRVSKAAVNMVGTNLAHDLAPDGIAVLLLHPGYVRTGMTGGRGNWEAEEASKAMVARIDELTLKQTGSFWHAEGQQIPW